MTMTPDRSPPTKVNDYSALDRRCQRTSSDTRTSYLSSELLLELLQSHGLAESG